MSDPGDIRNRKPATQNHRSRAVLPKTKVGWWATGLTVIGIASWVILPVITITFRDKYPVTDTWVMPAIGTALIDLAAVFNLLCVWPWRERSVLNIVMTVLTVLAALLLTFIVVAESIGSGV